MATDRLKMSMKEFLLPTAIEIKEKEAEYMKILQRLEQIGADITEFALTDPTRHSASAAELPAAAGQPPDEDVEVGEAVEAAATKSKVTLNPYEMPPEPKLEDYGISEDTLKLMKMSEMGLSFPTPTPAKRVMNLQSPNYFAMKPQTQWRRTPVSNGRALDEVSRNCSCTTPENYTRVKYACTPDLFQPSQLMVPRKSKIPTPLRKADFKQATPKTPIRLPNVTVTVDPNSLFGGLRTPVTPTLSADYSFTNTCGLPTQCSVTGDGSPTLHAKVPLANRSPISPELTSSLNWVKLK